MAQRFVRRWAVGPQALAAGPAARPKEATNTNNRRTRRHPNTFSFVPMRAKMCAFILSLNSSAVESTCRILHLFSPLTGVNHRGHLISFPRVSRPLRGESAQTHYGGGCR